jgi:soluble lytic murein transglycosylase-like protein
MRSQSADRFARTQEHIGSRLPQFRSFSMKFAIVFCLIAICPSKADKLAGAPPPTAQQQREAVERAMEASLVAQRASVARQANTAREGSFFLLPGIATPAAPPQANCPPLDRNLADSLIRDAAKRTALDPDLLASVARQESGMRPCALSPKGAMGLMQLMPATARELGVADPFDPAQSIDAGARLLRKYIDIYGSVPLALGAYNAGPGRVTEAGDVPGIRETIEYVQRILSVAFKK